MSLNQKILVSLSIMVYSVFSYAIDSSGLAPPEKAKPMHRTTHIDLANTKHQKALYHADGSQIIDNCPKDHALVNIQNTSKQVYYGPPAALCVQYGECEGFGRYCPGFPHSCCPWVTNDQMPCVGYTEVKWRPRPNTNQAGNLNENMPAVLSNAGCAPIQTAWEEVNDVTETEMIG